MCDDDYQNFRGSSLAEMEQKSRKQGSDPSKPLPAAGHGRPSQNTAGSGHSPFRPQVESNLTPPSDPKSQHLKDVIVLRQLNTAECADDYSKEGNNGGRLNRVTHVNESLFAHARVGSGDHKIIAGADNSFSLNSEMGLIHNLTQQEWNNSNNRSSPEVKFAKLRQAQIDFNCLQKQRTAAAVAAACTSMT